MPALEQQVAVVTEIRDDDGNVVEVFDEKEILYGIAEKTLEDSLTAKSLDLAGAALQRFRMLSQASSMAIAKLLHGVNSRWMEWEHDGETFVAWAVRVTGYDAQTIKKRVCEWEFLNTYYIPQEYHEKISGYTVRQLDKVYSIALSPKENKEGGYINFIEEDYDITPDQWLKLSEAMDEQMVSDVVHEVKDKDRNSNFMSLKIDDDGVLWVGQGQDFQTYGQLFVGKDIALVQKAIRRTMKNSGITERTEY